MDAMFLNAVTFDHDITGWQGLPLVHFFAFFDGVSDSDKMGLTLVHFSAQPEQFLLLKPPNIQIYPTQMLTSS